MSGHLHHYLFIVIFCFDSIFYHLYLSITHTENGNGQNIKPNFTSKTLKYALKHRKEDTVTLEFFVVVLFFWGFVLFCFSSEKMGERWVDIIRLAVFLLLLFCFFCLLTKYIPSA